jgi:hypothetical protein
MFDSSSPQEVTNMKYRVALWIPLALAVMVILWAKPASAGLDTWHFGAGFNVGGIFFRVGYAEAGPFGSSFYFEAAKPFHYRGHGCSSYCYRRGPRYYHHPTCSAVHHHFGYYGYAPAYFLEHYGPPLHYRPPVHYHAPPRWNVHFYGHYGDHRYGRDRYYRDRHYRDRYYRDKHGRHKYDRYKHDRGKKSHRWDHRRPSHRGRYDDHGRYDRRDKHDRRNGGRFERD